MLNDITWTGCDHTQVGRLPGGMTVSLEAGKDGIYVDMNGEPVMDLFASMDQAKDWVEQAILPFVRHLNPAQMINGWIDGLEMAA
jgi:hypothetical protein